MKQCTTCRSVKPVEGFHKNASKRDGLQSQCKSCVADYDSTPAVRAAKAAYNASPAGKAYDAAYKKTPARRESQRKTDAKRYATPEGKLKQQARNAVRHAVQAGLLDRASTLDCLHCGEPAQEWHHWFGYAKAFHFWILPLCRRCHQKVHKISTPSVHHKSVPDQSTLNASLECASFVGAEVRP